MLRRWRDGVFFLIKPRVRSRLTLTWMILLTSGCTTVSRSTADTFGLLFKRHEIEPNSEQVAALRYPQILLRTPDVNGIVVLAQIDSDRRQAWYAGHSAVLYLEGDGLLSGLASKGHSASIRIEGDNPFTHLGSIKDKTAVQRRYDWITQYLYDVPVTGSLRRVRQESVDILGHTLQLIRFEETLKGPGFSETNLYWTDAATGFIWKSRQYLAPGYAVEIVQLKPYRPAKS